MIGAHGYCPDEPPMNAAFIAAGAGVSANSIDRIRMIDIAPTIATLLGVRLPGVDGRVVPEVVRTAQPRRDR